MSDRKKVFDMNPKARKIPSREAVFPTRKKAAVKVVSKPTPKPAPKNTVKPTPKVRYFSTLEKKPKTKSNKKMLIAIASICLIIIGFSIAWVRATATIVVVPKTQDFSLLTMPFTAFKDATSTDALSYEVIDIKDEQHILAPATSGPSVQVKAKGTVIIYNDFSPQPIKIVQGTRLSNTVGKIYLTTTTLTVPGYTTATLKNGIKGKVAGSSSVVVVASAAGPDYNIDPTDLTGDFKVVAYKGTPKFDDIYGRLNLTTSISGGFIGQKQIIATSTLAQGYALAEKTVQESLVTKAKASIPAGYILFDGAYSVDYTTLSPSASSSTIQNASSADIGVTAHFHGILFKKHELSQAIARTKKIDINAFFSDGQYNEKNMESLMFNITNQKTFSFTNGAPISFALSGSFRAVGFLDSSDLVKRILGKDRPQSKVIFDGYGSISEIHATISPFWRFTFPDSPNKITVTQKE